MRLNGWLLTKTFTEYKQWISRFPSQYPSSSSPSYSTSLLYSPHKCNTNKPRSYPRYTGSHYEFSGLQPALSVLVRQHFHRVRNPSGRDLLGDLSYAQLCTQLPQLLLPLGASVLSLKGRKVNFARQTLETADLFDAQFFGCRKKEKERKLFNYSAL